MRKNIGTLLQDALDVCEDLDISVGKITDISWNPRLKSVWGRCFWEDGLTFRIELNTALNLDEVSWESALNTVIHEVLHCHKDRFGHTGEWKRCAELINREYPVYNIRRCTSAEEKGITAQHLTSFSYKYKVICLDCGNCYNYKREGKIIKLLKRDSTSCKCGCGSNRLKLIKL